MKPSRNLWKIAGTACLCLLAFGVVLDFVRAGQQQARQGALPLKPPPDVMDPANTAYRPLGRDWDAYLRQSPLKVGARVPHFEVKDSRGRSLAVPSASGPSIWVLSCGCTQCSFAAATVRDLTDRFAGQFTPVVFHINPSAFVWSMMRGMVGTSVYLVWDGEGDNYRKLRIPGDTYVHKPAVWGIDRRGIVRFFARPKVSETTWDERLAQSLGLREVKSPGALGG
jgi:hypothetical protein